MCQLIMHSLYARPGFMPGVQRSCCFESQQERGGLPRRRCLCSRGLSPGACALLPCRQNAVDKVRRAAPWRAPPASGDAVALSPQDAARTEHMEPMDAASLIPGARKRARGNADARTDRRSAEDANITVWGP